VALARPRGRESTADKQIHRLDEGDFSSESIAENERGPWIKD
jgi:hypothetical protein